MSALLPPALLARLRGLAIVPRRAPPHGPLGQNASRQRGTGLEFSQYRAYEQGDEPRRIDWKLYARSDRWYVREAESEAALAVWVVLDASASMQQAEHDAPERSKWRAAQLLAAATLELALRQGERFGLAVVTDGAVEWTPAGAGIRHRDRCLLLLERIEPRGAWPQVTALRAAWEHVPAAAVLVMVGDGFDASAEAFALRMAATGRDVRSIAISALDERQFTLRGSYVFEDPETGASVELHAPAARTAFLEAFDTARRALDHRLSSAGVRHVEHVLGAAPERALRAALGAGVMPMRRGA